MELGSGFAASRSYECARTWHEVKDSPYICEEGHTAMVYEEGSTTSPSYGNCENTYDFPTNIDESVQYMDMSMSSSSSSCSHTMGISLKFQFGRSRKRKKLLVCHCDDGYGFSFSRGNARRLFEKQLAYESEDGYDVSLSHGRQKKLGCKCVDCDLSISRGQNQGYNDGPHGSDNIIALSDEMPCDGDKLVRCHTEDDQVIRGQTQYDFKRRWRRGKRTSPCSSDGIAQLYHYSICGKGSNGNKMLYRIGNHRVLNECVRGFEGSPHVCRDHQDNIICICEMCSKSACRGTLIKVSQDDLKNSDQRAHGSTSKGCTREICSWDGRESLILNGLNNFDDKLSTRFKCFPCNKHGKEQISLCGAHSALDEDHRVHGKAIFEGTLSQGLEIYPLYAKSRECIHKEDKSPSRFDGNKHLHDDMDDEEYGRESELSSNMISGKQDGMEDGTSQHPKVGLFSSILSEIPIQTLALGSTLSISKPQDQTPRSGSILKSCISSPNIFGTSSKHRHQSRICQRRKPSMDDGIFNMSSLHLPEERVHGGNLMAILGQTSD